LRGKKDEDTQRNESDSESLQVWSCTCKLYGDVTLPGLTGIAKHARVFMLAGNNSVKTSSGISLQW